MSTAREARRDAREYARAEMFYGEGAGTRRKLIQATVEGKAARDPNYSQAFYQELNKQDMAEHASAARKERRRKDAVESISKNTKAIATGNYQGVQSTFLAVGVAAYFAHQTGLDKKAYEKGKEIVADVKYRIRRRRAIKAVLNND